VGLVAPVVAVEGTAREAVGRIQVAELPWHKAGGAEVEVVAVKAVVAVVKVVAIVDVAAVVTVVRLVGAGIASNDDVVGGLV
jgi:hypothetical protein